MAQKIFIIAGCNGAGKTTASLNILPQILQCDEFVNAVCHPSIPSAFRSKRAG